MSKKLLSKKWSLELPDERDLEAADALLELSDGGGCLLKHCSGSFMRKHGISHTEDFQSDDHGKRGVLDFGMHDKQKETANAGLNLQFVTGKNSETNHKKRKFKADDSSIFSNKVAKKDRNVYEDHELWDDNEPIRHFWKKGKQRVEDPRTDQQENVNSKHLKNKKAEGNWQRTSYIPHLHTSDYNDHCGSSSSATIDKPISSKKNLNFVREGFSPMLSNPNPKGKAESLLKSTKRQPSASVTPPRYPGFSYSIIHLLSAVRIALITPHSTESDVVFGKCVKGDDKRKKYAMEIHSEVPKGSFGLHKNESGIAISDRPVQKNLLYLTIEDIVHRVKLNPGDTRILKLSMPLHDLVRGVLKIFTSKAAPAGATSWKALAVYDKTSKTWSWTGPGLSRLRHAYSIEEQISAEAWGVPRRILAKLVDSFAHWMKSCEEVLQKIRSLPPPPLTLMQCSSVSERFNDGKAKKSLLTLSPSCEEVRAYFHREEALRYSIPEHAFSYTALDGKKSTVAPLIRCSGKPASRIRDHFILKQDRPPQFTVLCLVRDAAARLPGHLGTRLDICSLVRDSQFILEDASDMQINQVISGALDRLHYEVDPCVRFHKGWRAWVYLHADRQEEDFDQDCTSSRKIRKRETVKSARKSQTVQGSTEASQH